MDTHRRQIQERIRRLDKLFNKVDMPDKFNSEQKILKYSPIFNSKEDENKTSIHYQIDYSKINSNEFENSNKYKQLYIKSIYQLAKPTVNNYVQNQLKQIQSQNYNQNNKKYDHQQHNLIKQKYSSNRNDQSIKKYDQNQKQNNNRIIQNIRRNHRQPNQNKKYEYVNQTNNSISIQQKYNNQPKLLNKTYETSCFKNKQIKEAIQEQKQNDISNRNQIKCNLNRPQFQNYLSKLINQQKKYNEYSPSKHQSNNTNPKQHQQINSSHFVQQYMKIKNQQQLNNTQSDKTWVSDYTRSTMSQKIKQRMRQSESKYKDAYFKNCKHQHQHLINTYDFQSKLRDELIKKAYELQDSKLYK